MGNFFHRIADAASRGPDRVAVEMVGGTAGEETTYRSLMAEASAIASWLRLVAGVAQGDRVAILAPNDARWIAAYLGAFQLGAVVVPLDTAYKTTDVRTILADSGARVLFTTARYETVSEGAVAGLDNPARVALLSQAWPMPPPGSEIAPTRLDDEDAAVILYTSGTTADPKGVVLTHANLDAERRSAFEILRVGPDDIVLGVLPLFHALAQMANLLLPLSAGARVVFLESVNSTTLLDALQTRGITAFACVPQFFYLIHERVMRDVSGRGRIGRAIFRGVLTANVFVRDRFGRNPGRRFFARVHRVLGPRMRILITGGSRVDPAIARDLYGMGFTLQNAYGLTETSGGATMVRAGDRFTTSVGQPFPEVEIRIDRKNTAAGPDVREGAPDGEVLIRGPIVMREYFGRPDRTAEVLVDGWLRTGDLGWIDDDGRLFITGREKEIIVLASGKNLYPEEIEAHYRQSPFIKEIAVLGLTDPAAPAAERLYAVVVPDEAVLRERGIVNVRELIRFELETWSASLPAHKRVLGFDVSLDPLPKATTGKLRRREIHAWVDARKKTGPIAREPTADERAWLDEPAHGEIVDAIARRIDRAMVLPDANLELDLGLDSMERVEVLTLAEERAGRRVPADARATIFTVRQLVAAVLAAPEGASARNSDSDADDDAWERVLAEPADPSLVANLARSKWIRALVLYAGVRVAGAIAAVLFRFRVKGREHLPAGGRFIISPNHQTFMDGFFLCAALPFRTFRALFLVGAAEFFETPLMAWLARAVNIVPLDPDRTLVTAMQAAAAGLNLDKVLVLFPEGERSIDGWPKPFRKGAAILAAQLAVPIVPVAIDGLFDIWPRGRSISWRALLPWRARPITIAFGRPEIVRTRDYQAETDALYATVNEMFAGLRQTRKDDAPMPPGRADAAR